MCNWKLTTLGILIFLSNANVLLARREVTESLLTSAVQLELQSGGMGSGFFFTTGSAYYLVTAKHVLFADSQKLKSNLLVVTAYHGVQLFEKKCKWKIDLAELDRAGLVRKHSEYDVSVLKLGEVKSFPDGEKYIKYFSGVEKLTYGGIINAFGLEQYKKFDDILVSNEIYISGFPTSVGNIKYPRFEYTKPLFKRGIIAGLNAIDKYIILDCMVFFGNSGGPVIEKETVSLGNTQYKLIGLVVEFIPFIDQSYRYGNITITNSGYSVAVPMDFALELMQ
jgi:trypsin-like peptidase